MAFKINISEKNGKTYNLELDNEVLVGKTIHDILQGVEIFPDLTGYELEITGASDKAGFPVMKDVEGLGLSKALLRYGKGMKKRPRREGKKKISNNTPKGLRLRKTVRANIISQDITQVNLKVLKEGSKKLSEVFLDQGHKVEENRAFKRKQKATEPKVEEKPEEPKLEVEKSQEEVKTEEKSEEKPE